ncbi:MAG: serine/threonine-protein kinase, partial [Myxococcota bacterium]
MAADARTTRAVRNTAFAAPITAPSAKVGALVGGKYRVVGELGTGAMGVVLRGRDEQLERDVAIKLIRPEQAQRPSFQQDFLAEARTMAKIGHPNVVRVFDFGWEEATPYFVMELVDGVDLESYHADHDYHLGTAAAVELAVKICHGVEAIHQSGAAHRDLKPNNILIAGDGRVLVSDLGLTETRPDEGDIGVVGTPGFVAPEVILHGPTTGDLAARGDVYALGALAYELLSGQPAFGGDDATAVLSAQLGSDFIPLHQRDPSLGRGFNSVIDQALAFDPRDRLPSAAELLQRLEHALALRQDPTSGRRIVVADDDLGVRRWLQRVLA